MLTCSKMEVIPSHHSTGTNGSRRKRSSVLKSFVAGSTSGAISCVLFQPLDLVKTRLQADGTWRKLAAGAQPAKKPLTIVSTVYNVIHKENTLALWRGLTPSLYRTVPGVGMYFCTLHVMKSFWKNDPTFYENLLLGFSARGLVGATLLPVTVIKARFESGKFNYETVPQALKHIWKLEGFRGLYSGFTATIARDAPYSGLYLMFYSQQKTLFKSVRGDDLGAQHLFACGLLAGVLASTVTHPADVVKTQLQLYPSRYASTMNCVQIIYQRYGASGFFRGMLPRCLRRTLISALSWTVFEGLMKQLNLKV